jgi:Flp pilus assembly protein TadG
MKNRKRTSGSAMIEFTLVGIPIIFTLISIFEISRGMWYYETLNHTVKETARYLIVRGQNCIAAGCGASYADIKQFIQNASLGLNPDDLTVTLTDSGGVGATSTLTNLAGAGTFPVDPNAGVGQLVTVRAQYPFRTALSMFWPGAGYVPFGPIWFAAVARERIRY